MDSNAVDTATPQGDRRIYVQMKPTDGDIRALESIIGSLSPQKSGRPMPPAELHITLIHFGKEADVLAALRRVTTVDDETYARERDAYLGRTATLLTDDGYDLEPRGYARFGKNRGALVGRYDAPRALHEIHSAAYGELIRFIGAFGIRNTEGFAAHDANFGFAHSFNPHATLYKGYDGPDPEEPLPPLTVRFMPLTYEGRGV